MSTVGDRVLTRVMKARLSKRKIEKVDDDFCKDSLMPRRLRQDINPC